MRKLYKCNRNISHLHKHVKNYATRYILYYQDEAPSVMHGFSPKQIHRVYTQVEGQDRKETKFQYDSLKHHSNVTISFGAEL